MTAAILTFGLVLLVMAAWFMLRGSIWEKRATDPRPLHAIDVPAFRSLLQQEDDIYLRNKLSRKSYRQVTRARVRAAQEYLLWIAEDCLTLQVHVQALASHQVAGTAPEHSLIRSTIRMRCIALMFWLWLWAQWIFPEVVLMPYTLAERYGNLMRNVTQFEFEARSRLQMEMRVQSSG